MAHLVVFTFINDGDPIDDGYHVTHQWVPNHELAAKYIERALPFAWALPRYEPDEFAAAFIAGNKESCARRAEFWRQLAQTVRTAAEESLRQGDEKTYNEQIDLVNMYIRDAVDWESGKHSNPGGGIRLTRLQPSDFRYEAHYVVWYDDDGLRVAVYDGQCAVFTGFVSDLRGGL